MRKRRNLLWISLIMTMLFGMASVGVPVSAGSTVLAVDPPMKVDTTLTPGSTFHINITVADVERMWAYQFVLSYDTTVLTATEYSSYSPFIIPWPSELNDAEGYVAISYSMMFDEPIGFSTVDPAPVARIDFSVDALGYSVLDLHDSIVTNVDAQEVVHEAFDGLFANILIEWRADLVKRSAWPEHHHWDESKDLNNTLTGKVKTLGNMPVKAKVVFTIADAREDPTWSTSVETPEDTIGPGVEKDLTHTVTVGDLDPVTPYGRYYVSAQCWYDSDGDGIIDSAGAKIKPFSFALVP